MARRERGILKAVGEGIWFTGLLANTSRPYEGRSMENVRALSNMRAPGVDE
jgi:hypothetical protein